MLSGSSPPAPAAALIGRAAEVEDVLDLLGRARLVTLTGPPGVGKTRLALAVCADRDDVSWVDLAPIRDPRQVRAELARASRPDGDPTDRLVVLDNCEHLLDSDLADQLAELLRSTARLQVLATSRERLRLAAEREYAVPPLPMPSDDDADDPARLRGNPAVTLLLDRAPPAVQLTPNTARALAEICIGLDGLPLAIELAAARLRVFTPSELAFRLGRRMSVLTSGPRDAPDRHRDLRAAIAWSHDLLSERDRAAFRRLSVFPGEWNLESAAAVCAEPDVLDVVESLLDKSLVRRAGEDLDGDARFTMLMSLREYAAEQLEEQAEGQATRDRHATWFTRRALEWEATIGTTAETDTWPQLAAFRADLEAALVHARAADEGEQVVWLAAALAWFGYTRGDLAEAEVPLAELVAAVDDERADPDARAAGRLAAGVTAYGLGRRDLAEELLGPFRAADGAPEERRGAVARAFLGHLARERGDLADAAALYTAARTTHVRLGNTRGIAWAGHDLALLALDEDRTDDAEQLLTESLELFDSIDYDWAVAVCACLLASAVVRRGSAADVDRAAALLARALRLHDEVGDRRGMAQCLGGDGRGGAGPGRSGHRRATRRCRCRAAVSAPPRSRPRPRRGTWPTSTSASTACSAAPPPSASGTRAGPCRRPRPSSWPVGLAAVGTEDADGAVVALTPRQLEVAVLVAAGRTNRQIGTALGISEKTTEVHVHNLMARLDVPSRAGVAAWAAARGLTQHPTSLGVSPNVPGPAVARRQRSGRNAAARTGPRGRWKGHDMDEDKLNEMLGRFVGDLGATITAGGVVIGHRLGLYRALADGPGTAEEVARRTGCDPRYVAEWLRGQGAGGYVTYDAEGDTWSLTEEQAFVLANPDGAVYAPGAYVLALGSLQAIDRIEEAFKTGAGVGWHEHDDEVFVGCEQFFRPGYLANLVPSWIPALDGVQAKLEAGAKVADVGCGLGASTILLAEQFPQAQLAGLRLPRGVHRAGAQAGRRRRRRRADHLRDRERAGLRRQRLRPGRDVRLPARHG